MGWQGRMSRGRVLGTTLVAVLLGGCAGGVGGVSQQAAETATGIEVPDGARDLDYGSEGIGVDPEVWISFTVDAEDLDAALSETQERRLVTLPASQLEEQLAKMRGDWSEIDVFDGRGYSTSEATVVVDESAGGEVTVYARGYG